MRADAALFAGGPAGVPRRTAARLGLGAAAATVNAGAGRVEVSLIGIALLMGIVAIELAVGGRARSHPRPAGALALAAGLGLAAALAGAGGPATAELTARALCGAGWMLWLAWGLDWPAVRALALRWPALQGPVELVDQTVLQAALTVRCWAEHRDQAQLRRGPGALPMAAWGVVLRDGVLAALHRAEDLDATAQARRAAAPPDGGAGPEPVPAALEARALRVGNGPRPRLQGLDLRLPAGAWLAVCGPSGAGKTSLLRAAAGLEPAGAGELLRFGAPVPAAAPLPRRVDGRVGLMVQNPEHHFLASTAAEDVAWAPLARGQDPAAARARAADELDRLGLGDRADAPVHALSFGEQRRVSLAGLLAADPELLLLDEPTAGLDPVAAAALVTALGAARARRPMAGVWVTHEPRALPPWIDRIVLLRDGRLVFDGSSADALMPDRLRAAGLLPPGPPPPLEPA